MPFKKLLEKHGLQKHFPALTENFNSLNKNTLKPIIEEMYSKGVNPQEMHLIFLQKLLGNAKANITINEVRQLIHEIYKEKAEGVLKPQYSFMHPDHA
ncbi:MAG: hypothetical protein JW703_04005 [Candidatus Diapherotrites archaeon]|nr:hypothetical protein [Candidatus Diapherotrites archaeon]